MDWSVIKINIEIIAIIYRVCMLGDHLLQASAILPANASISQICNYCNPENP